MSYLQSKTNRIRYFLSKLNKNSKQTSGQKREYLILIICITSACSNELERKSFFYCESKASKIGKKIALKL